MIDLDRIDCGILRELRINSRISNKELAQRVGLAPSTTIVRVRSLQTAGVIKGFHAAIDPKSLRVSLQAMISVQLGQHEKQDVLAFREHALNLAEVVQLFHVAGGNDFLLQVWVRDADHLRELILQEFTSRPEVSHIETGLIFEHVQSIAIPNYGEEADLEQ